MNEVRDAGAAGDGGNPSESAQAGAPHLRRPLLERIGMAGIALVLGGLFVIVAIAGYTGGELFLAGMGAIGALMTFWVGALTLFRG